MVRPSVFMARVAAHSFAHSVTDFPPSHHHQEQNTPEVNYFPVTSLHNLDSAPALCPEALA